MIYDRVWKEIKYYALTNYIESIKANASITKTISHWEREAKKTLAESYHDYVGKLLSNIADVFRTSARDDAQVNKLASVLIVPAGFGADLGAEKFIDIKCRMADIKPDAVIIVVTVRALKYNGGVDKANLNETNLEALEKGLPNLLKHVENITQVFKLPAVVAINEFPTDSEEEINLIKDKCKELGVNVALSEVWARGGEKTKYI